MVQRSSKRVPSLSCERSRARDPDEGAGTSARSPLPCGRRRRQGRAHRRAPALRRRDRGSLPALRSSARGARERGQLRSRPRSRKVRRESRHAIRHVRRVLDPRVHPEPRDPIVEHRRERLRRASLEDVLQASSRARAHRQSGGRRAGGRRAARRIARNAGSDREGDAAQARGTRRFARREAVRRFQHHARRSAGRRRQRSGSDARRPPSSTVASATR